MNGCASTLLRLQTLYARLVRVARVYTAPPTVGLCTDYNEMTANQISVANHISFSHISNRPSCASGRGNHMCHPYGGGGRGWCFWNSQARLAGAQAGTQAGRASHATFVIWAGWVDGWRLNVWLKSSQRSYATALWWMPSMQLSVSISPPLKAASKGSGSRPWAPEQTGLSPVHTWLLFRWHKVDIYTFYDWGKSLFGLSCFPMEKSIQP